MKSLETAKNMELYSLSTLNYIRKKFGFHNAKSLGQNFLTDNGVIDSIIEATNISEEDLVIEIGPGIGVLTVEAARKAGKVCAIEIDKNLLPVLDFTLKGYDNIEVINQDVLKTNLNDIIKSSTFQHTKVIGNLPYYITTPIIMYLLENEINIESITIMMQKEVADRIIAGPGSKTFGAISLAVQYYCEVSEVTDVPKEVFYPVPKVDSTVLKLSIRTEKPVHPKNEKLMFNCIKAGFGQRRKTILNSLTGAGFSKDEIKQALERLSIEPKRRAETLSIEDFAAISDELAVFVEKKDE